MEICAHYCQHCNFVYGRVGVVPIVIKSWFLYSARNVHIFRRFIHSFHFIDISSTNFNELWTAYRQKRTTNTYKNARTLWILNCNEKHDEIRNVLLQVAANVQMELHSVNLFEMRAHVNHNRFSETASHFPIQWHAFDIGLNESIHDFFFFKYSFNFACAFSISSADDFVNFCWNEAYPLSTAHSMANLCAILPSI